MQERPFVAWCQRVTSDRAFQWATTIIIVFTAVLMGVETDDRLMAAYGPIFHGINKAIQAIFVLELLLRLGAYYPRLGNFFREGWNVFDFVIVVVTLLPAAGPFAAVVRLARVLRILRLISVSPELRLIVETMLRSVPSMGNVALLLGILMYVFSILGHELFGTIDPAHWGDLGRSVLSCFQMLTLEGWVEMQAAVIDEKPHAYLFFGTYVLLAVFVVVNLFIAIILNNLEGAKAAIERERNREQSDLTDQIHALREQLDRFEKSLAQRPVAPPGTDSGRPSG